MTEGHKFGSVSLESAYRCVLDMAKVVPCSAAELGSGRITQVVLVMKLLRGEQVRLGIGDHCCNLGV